MAKAAEGKGSEKPIFLRFRDATQVDPHQFDDLATDVRESLTSRLSGHNQAAAELAHAYLTIAGRASDKPDRADRAIAAVQELLGSVGNIIGYGDSEKPLSEGAVQRLEAIAELAAAAQTFESVVPKLDTSNPKLREFMDWLNKAK